MKVKLKMASVLLLLPALLVTAAAAPAAAQVGIVVKTVLASNEGTYMDPGLGPLLGELRSVFRYSSYRLLGQDRLNLDIQQPGSVSLPGRHTLQIVPRGIAGDRAELELSMLKSGKRTFNTVVQLRNRSSVTVGGPKHQGGYLLFNVSASF